MQEIKVKPGYKMSELGVIPEDWEVKELGEIADITMGQSPNSEFYNIKGIGLPLIQGNADIKNRKTVIRNYTSQTTKKGKKGDIIMTVRAPVGYVAKSQFDNCIGRGVCSISYENDYLYYYLIKLETYWEKLSTGSTFDSVNSESIKSLNILLPKIKEQKLIAQTLSDTDELISSLDELIEKKEKIKEGTMQELLTGKRRLPGFEGEWEEKRLGDICEIKTGIKNNQDKKDNGKYPFYVRSQTIERIDTFSYDCEAILIPGEGGIGSIFHYINGKFNYHQRVYKVSNFNENIYGKYIFYYMKRYFGNHAMKNSVKATVDSLRLPTFQEFKMFLPSKFNEQKSIADVLSDMDNEIEKLEIKRDKYKQIKEGMMQELLTGRTRLV